MHRALDALAVPNQHGAGYWSCVGVCHGGGPRTPRVWKQDCKIGCDCACARACCTPWTAWIDHMSFLQWWGETLSKLGLWINGWMGQSGCVRGSGGARSAYLHFLRGARPCRSPLGGRIRACVHWCILHGPGGIERRIWSRG